MFTVIRDYKELYAMIDQLGRVTLLSGIIFIMLGFGSDGAPSLVQTRTPPPSVLGVPIIPSSLSGYSYTIMKLGPLQFTRKGLSVASTSACLSFAVCPSFHRKVFAKGFLLPRIFIILCFLVPFAFSSWWHTSDKHVLSGKCTFFPVL